jgi:nucleotide-binding universal stress UspA family protein
MIVDSWFDRQEATMKRFKRILVHISADEPLPSKLETAVDLAHRNDASLTLYDVVPAIPAATRFLRTGSSQVDVETAMADDRLERLDSIASGLDVPHVDTAVGHGSGYVEIIRRVIDHQHDLIITAPDEPRRLGFAGAATTMHLMRKSPVPVWVHSAAEVGAHGVAVAIGPFDTERRNLGLNLTLMQLASSLAVQRDEALHVISAWRLQGESMLRSSRSSFTDREVNDMLSEARAEAQSEIDRLISEIGPIPVPVEVHLSKGEPGLTVAATVNDVNPNTLVMGTIARTGLSGMIIGNTAEQVLGLIQTSVIAVKPEGFESPVTA